MNRSQPQHSNIESFVRKNTILITRSQMEENPDTGAASLRRTYKCKDCNKEYDNFQALGGHRAGHQFTRPVTRPNTSLLGFQENNSNVKLHGCKICKKGFPTGQALGGHMRKHWKKNFEINVETGSFCEDNDAVNERSFVDSSSSSWPSSIVFNSFNGKEVFGYDLNLTPEQNEARNGCSVTESD